MNETEQYEITIQYLEQIHSELQNDNKNLYVSIQYVLDYLKFKRLIANYKCDLCKNVKCDCETCLPTSNGGTKYQPKESTE